MLNRTQPNQCLRRSHHALGPKADAPCALAQYPHLTLEPTMILELTLLSISIFGVVLATGWTVRWLRKSAPLRIEFGLRIDCKPDGGRDNAKSG